MRSPSPILDAAAEFRVLRAGPREVGQDVLGGACAGRQLAPVAPAFVVRVHGPWAEAAAEALWRRAGEGRPRDPWTGAPDAAGGPGAARWVADLLRAHGLRTRLWPEAVCTVTRSDLPGMWEFSIRSPAVARVGAAAPWPDAADPVEGVHFRVGPTQRRAVRNLLRRSGWLFLVLCAGDRTVGVLAVRHVEEAGGAPLAARWRGGWERLGAWCLRAMDGGAAEPCRAAGPQRCPSVARTAGLWRAGAPASAAFRHAQIRTSSTRVEVTVESCGEVFDDADAVFGALADQARRDLAPVLYVTFRGSEAQDLAAAIWDAHDGPAGDGRRAPGPWVGHFAATRGLDVRVAEGAVLRLRHRGGSWTESWLTALGTRAAAAPDAGAGGRPLWGPDAMIGWRLDSATAAHVEAALGRSGWVFVVLGTGGRSVGVLAVRHAEVMRGPAVPAGLGG